MTRARTAWLLLGTLCLASFTVAQDTAWEEYMKAGLQAHQQGRYAEAEKSFLAALNEVEKFGDHCFSSSGCPGLGNLDTEVGN